MLTALMEVHNSSKPWTLSPVVSLMACIFISIALMNPYTLLREQFLKAQGSRGSGTIADPTTEGEGLCTLRVQRDTSRKQETESEGDRY